jgi:RNA polymerase sigma factor (TIGR02999 family)
MNRTMSFRRFDAPLPSAGAAPGGNPHCEHAASPDDRILRISADMNAFTQILDRADGGDAEAAYELLPLVYDELRRLAVVRLRQETPGQTLQPTALVHEAWLRLTAGQAQSWKGRRHFFAAAAEAMRRILIDNARRKRRPKHGGAQARVDQGNIDLAGPLRPDELLALDGALDRLAVVNARAVQVVKLCYFAGLTQTEAARELGISAATAERSWSFARAWLYREIKRELES